MNDSFSVDKAKQELLKEIILDLHKGKDVSEVKKRFSRLIKDLSPEEISAMENSLIEGGLPVEQVQNLCNVHVDVFKTALKAGKPKKIPGHPVHTFMMENREAKKRLRTFRSLTKKAASLGTGQEKILREALNDIRRFDLHFLRKENQLFPLLEAGGFTGPSKVMWGKHDEIRDLFREAEKSLEAKDWKRIRSLGREISRAIKKMIFMEERILFPTSLKRVSDRQWAGIRRAEPDIGYAWIKPGNLWDSDLVGGASSVYESPLSFEPEKEAKPVSSAENAIPLSVGALTPEQIDLLLRNIPFDVTFVDEKDKVRYYSQGKERIFVRTPEIIGRDVRNCHPPKSLHVVTDILESFKKKEKTEAEFWIILGGRFVHIRYFPLYDSEGKYRGVIEVSQDATDIRALAGERRLLDW